MVVPYPEVRNGERLLQEQGLPESFTVPTQWTVHPSHLNMHQHTTFLPRLQRSSCHVPHCIVSHCCYLMLHCFPAWTCMSNFGACRGSESELLMHVNDWLDSSVAIRVVETSFAVLLVETFYMSMSSLVLFVVQMTNGICFETLWNVSQNFKAWRRDKRNLGIPTLLRLCNEDWRAHKTGCQGCRMAIGIVECLRVSQSF